MKDDDQVACKPGSVHSLWITDCWMTIPLGHSSPSASRDRPERPAWKRACPIKAIGPDGTIVPTWSCSRRGLPCRHCCQPRGALLPHPFTLTFNTQARPAVPEGGFLSVALSLGSPPPGVTRHRVSMEPGLSSPRQNLGAAIQPPDQADMSARIDEIQGRMTAHRSKLKKYRLDGRDDGRDVLARHPVRLPSPMSRQDVQPPPWMPHCRDG